MLLQWSPLILSLWDLAFLITLNDAYVVIFSKINIWHVKRGKKMFKTQLDRYDMTPYTLGVT